MRRMLVVVMLAGCVSQDQSDQRRLRDLCGLPANARVISWKGYPSQVGFGQREGLTLEGTFRPEREWSKGASGYRRMPWPTAVEAIRGFGRSASAPAWVLAATALRCETAGNDVLFAGRTRPCDTGPTPNDLIVCAVQPSGDVQAWVRSAY
ncbi:MAG: hypothetical protein JNJ54_15795 [Myxococcaceae bacterium]|nr:hypothetical protein [Myxococcaceae bacterium]